jgi:hypothetical protein
MKPGDQPKVAKDVREVFDILLEGGDEHRRVLRIKRSPKNGPSTPELVKEPQSRRVFQNLREGVNAENEKKRGKGVPLSQPTAMMNRGAGHPIEKNP